MFVGEVLRSVGTEIVFFFGRILGEIFFSNENV